MTQAISSQHNSSTARKITIGVGAIFIAEFVSLFFANARNIAQPGMVAELNGMALLLILTIPEISLDAETIEEHDSGNSAISAETSLP